MSSSLPVITVQNQSTNSNEAIEASSLIASVYDPNDYAITYYDFRDDGGDGGYFVLNGVVQPDGTWITVSAADLADLVYVGGPGAGSEAVDVAAWDGVAWSYYQTATVTTDAVSLPVIEVQAETVDTNASIAASSFIVSVSDPSDYPITYYDFRDEGGDGGYFALNGVPQPDDTWITVSAADLADLVYVGGPGAGSETINVAAWDGHVWSYYASASATTVLVLPPVITVQDETVNVRSSIAAASFINTVNDPNNYAISYYDFRDDGGDGGYFSLNGVAQPDGSWITVSAADLSDLVYVGGPSAGTESVDAAAWDGHVWSSYATATAITLANSSLSRPTITVNNESVVELEWIPASSLIASVSDPNNYAITYYDFRDDGGGGGYFALDGYRQPTGTWITVAASDLSNLIYVGGSTPGDETVDAAAWDGYAWSYYQTATVTTTAPVNVLPVITVANQIVNVGASIQASAFIASVSDPNNNVISDYDFRDDGGDNGYFSLGGVAQADDTWITVSAADLANLVYVGGPAAGSESVDVAAWDGQAWSYYETATATTKASSPPTITAQDQSVAANTSIQASTLIASVSDPNNYAITTYEFRDDGGDNGYLKLSGVAQADDTWITVSAADLNSLTYVGGPAAGSETVDVAAYDGHSWSAYASSVVTTTGGSAVNPVIALLKDPGIIADVEAGLSDNSLSYSAMLKILQDAAVGGDTATKFADLQTVVASFDKPNGIQVSSYVDYISNALINGDPANAYWTGGALTSVPLGNLTADSSSTQMDELIEKWFLGGDLPSLVFDSAVTCSYLADSNPLYNTTGLPAVSDINQGDLGDCYLLASLAEIAQDQPTVLESMITDNGNDTYGVEFYIGGKAVFVTVNNELPTYTDGAGPFGTTLVANNSPDIWSCLIEKAYVQLNEDPGDVPTATASGDEYELIDGGDADPITQLTGRPVISYNSQTYTLANWNNLKATIVSAIEQGEEVDFGSFGATTINGETAFVDGHMFSGIGYDTSTGDFIVRNPWGSEDGQDWLTEFEATMSDFYGVTGTLYVASGSTGAVPIQVATVVTVAQFEADQASLDQVAGGFDISDTAAAISAAVDQLNDPNINAITITDNGVVDASAAQTANDATAIGKLLNANSTPGRLAVVDTAVNVAANRAAINALIGEGRIASLTSTNITGQSYDETVETFDLSGDKTSLEYEGVTGEPYDAIKYDYNGTVTTGYTVTGLEVYYASQASGLTEQDLDGAGNLAAEIFSGAGGQGEYSSLRYDFSGTSATAYSETGVNVLYSGQNSGLSEVDYDGGGNLTRELFAYQNLGPGTLTGIELDYVAGQEADSLFTFAGPGGASYDRATYEFDSASSFVGATYQFTGQTYDEIQASFTPGTSPILTELTYGDYAGTGGPNEVSYFFDATGAPSAIQETFTGITGEAYTSDSVLYNASGTAVASEYSGYTTKPFSSLTYFDSASGATQEIVRDYTSDSSSGTVDGQAYSAHETIDNASNAPLGTAYQLDSGGNLYVGNASDVTSPTFGGTGVSPNAAELSYAITGGDWTITGGGTNETFTFASLFNKAEITDYGAAFNAGKPDVVSVSTLDFASWSVMLGDAAASGPGGANTTFTSTTTGDKLTLDGATVAQLHALTPSQANADFLFHA